MRNVYPIVACVGAALLLGSGCGGSTQHADDHAHHDPDHQHANVIASGKAGAKAPGLPPDTFRDQCEGESCPLPAGGTPSLPPMEVSADGLRIQFGDRLEREEALHAILHCRVQDSANPRLDGVLCPVDLTVAQIQVQEGPAGVSLHIHVGMETAEKLRHWYQHRWENEGY
jgi:hypothetical protein